MSSAPKQFILPDLLPISPLKGSTNPHYKEAGAESSAWINSYNVFADRKRAFFLQSSNELLVSHTFPYAGYQEFRTCCDFVNLLFVYDELSDDQNGEDARSTGQIMLNAMKDPKWDDGSVLAKITKEFQARYLRTAGKNTSQRFLKHFESYLDCVAKEAELRERGEVLDIDAFTDLRRDNSAIRLCFDLMEYALGIDLPHEVYEDPNFIAGYWAAVDMISWSNDVYSYDMEQAMGHTGNNIVTVLMKAKNIGLQAASDHVGVYFRELMDRYMTSKNRLPSWGPSVDADALRYLEAAGRWVHGNLDWSFEGQRYFGANNLEVKNTLVVTLRPRRVQDDDDEE